MGKNFQINSNIGQMVRKVHFMHFYLLYLGVWWPIQESRRYAYQLN